MLFSQRNGLKPVKEVLQHDSMDDDLRVGLWNVLDAFIFRGASGQLKYLNEHQALAMRLWHNYFKWPIDTIPSWWEQVKAELRSYFFEAAWHEVYDFVEFVASNYPGASASGELIEGCNIVMQRELAAWRFVGSRIAEVTSEAEIEEIEEALSSGAPNSAKTHLRAALDQLADRKSPNYRNSIKESINAVEAAINGLSGERSTLSVGLKKLPTPLHPALESALGKLYGWTSDADGIRHALMDEPTLAFEDAKFMLVSCSAFVNYLTAKAATAV